jgi:ABC-type branched-subunit amino acid transport system substrate-binding protein
MMIIPAKRLQNAFRLPASDDRAQVPTIAYVISKMNPRKVHLIAESDDKSKAYSFPLIAQLQRILTARHIEVEGPSELSSESVSDRAEEIYSSNVAEDLIVLAGYTTLSKKLLSTLEKKYADQQEKKPKLLFTEGASNIEEEAHGFTIFRTGYRDTSLCKLSDGGRNQKHSAEYTYGFDAVNIIKQALDQCSAEISRGCVTKELRNKPFFVGACEYYSFQNGDNILSNYYVFASDNPGSLFFDAPKQHELNQ